jgi:hypothetical protein
MRKGQACWAGLVYRIQWRMSSVVTAGTESHDSMVWNLCSSPSSITQWGESLSPSNPGDCHATYDYV